MTLEFRVDEYGYIYLLNSRGQRVDILVDVPNCQHYGKLILGASTSEKEVDKTNDEKRSGASSR